MLRRLPRLLAPSLRGRLSLLIFAVLCLGAMLAGWLIWQGYRNERHAMERHLSDTARALATLMEAELGKREELLKGLIASSFLANDDLQGFDLQARRIVAGTDEWIVLADVNDQQLVNTALPPGSPLPVMDTHPDYQAALKEGHGYISNLEISAATGREILFVTAPVPAPKGGWRRLCLVMTPGSFTQSLLNHRIGEGWLTAVIDRNMIIAGRSRNPANYIGKKASQRMIEFVSERPEGVVETVTLDGIPSITAFHRSPHSGWTVIVAAPRAELFAGARRLVMQALLVAIATGLLALFFAYWMGRSVIRGIHVLVKATETLARGDQLRGEKTGIDEIDLVSKALITTSNALATREAALARARDEALAASRAKDDFLAALSHELRTPLNPVLLLASDGAKDTSHPPAIREIFATIARNVAIEARLIDDLLDLTRISSGKLSLQLRPVPVDTLLRETVATLRRSIDEKPLSLTLDLNTAGAVTTGDHTRLQQVFWNLLNNAIKFTPANGRLAISSHADATAHQIVVAITDSGLGLTPSEIPRLFQRFAQGDHAAKGAHSEYGGLGLGLAIAHTLVTMHHGEITAASPGRDQGSTFTVRLPLLDKKTPATDNPSRQATAQMSLVSGDSSTAIASKRILLVEDHQPTLTTLEKLLTRRGYAVTPAATIARALEHAATSTFDLVISDIGLPDSDGYELMRELRRLYGLKGIAMSGYGADADRAKGKAAGFLHHLTKPVSIAQLEDALSRVFPVDPQHS